MGIKNNELIQFSIALKWNGTPKIIKKKTQSNLEKMPNENQNANLQCNFFSFHSRNKKRIMHQKKGT